MDVAPTVSPEGPTFASKGTGTMARDRFVIGTRSSKLAMIQTRLVITALQQTFPTHEFVVESMQTLGDKDKITPLHQFNAKALWTHELEALLVKGRLDMIVHSMKDVPTQLPPECSIGAVLVREDPRDAVVMRRGGIEETQGWRTLRDLPEDALVGTGSVRRQAQISRQFPKLRFRDVRGNVPTRLEKLDQPEKHGIERQDQVACTILAVAGLSRLGLQDRITQRLSSSSAGSHILHAVGQGALAIEVRNGDSRVTQILAGLNHTPTFLACIAERSLMRTLEGGCSVPIGVESQWENDRLGLTAVVVSLDGSQSAQASLTMDVSDLNDAENLGLRVAQALVEQGAGAVLKEITLNRTPVNT